MKQIQLMTHQKEFLNKNPNRALVAYPAGAGKSIIALLWLKERKNLKQLIITPKAIKEQWANYVKEFGLNSDILTKEQFKKTNLKQYDAIVFDEFHYANSPLFLRGKRSQITNHIYQYIKTHPDHHILGLTATPISSQPANAHTLLYLTDTKINWSWYRSKTYTLDKPYWLDRLQKKTNRKINYILTPKDNWRKFARNIVELYAYTAKKEDIFKKESKRVDHVVAHDLSNKAKELIIESIKNPLLHGSEHWFYQHKLEQIGKSRRILDITGQYSKIVIYAKYRQQVIDLAESLSKYRQTYVIHGGIKNYEQIINEAKQDSECYLVIQADIAEGYELPDFEAVVFASLSWKKISEYQAKARIDRINYPKENHYYYIVSNDFTYYVKGKPAVYTSKDRKVYDRIMAGEDFIIE